MGWSDGGIGFASAPFDFEPETAWWFEPGVPVPFT